MNKAKVLETLGDFSCVSKISLFLDVVECESGRCIKTLSGMLSQ